MKILLILLKFNNINKIEILLLNKTVVKLILLTKSMPKSDKHESTSAIIDGKHHKLDKRLLQPATRNSSTATTTTTIDNNLKYTSISRLSLERPQQRFDGSNQHLPDQFALGTCPSLDSKPKRCEQFQQLAQLPHQLCYQSNLLPRKSSSY